MSQPELDLEAGRSIWALGRYLIIAELGRGGMAEVYLAVARGPSGFSKLMVLKLLRAQYSEEQVFLDMFLAEARLAARLNHPNIVQTYEVAEEGGRHCIVMEYLDGRTLSELRHGATKMPLPLAARVLCDALAGLHHAHELLDLEGRPCGLVHRDISPQNIIVTYDGQVKVVDFGIAKANDSVVQTRTGMFKGKVRYAAPERFSSADDIDRRSDIFSMGVLLWEAATGRRLWHGIGDLPVMRHLACGEPLPLPSSVAPDLPPAIDVICAKALAVAPGDRYATALDMQDALEEYLSAAGSVPVTRRAVAKFMSEAFADQRERFQRVVDEQLRTVAHAPVEELPLSISRIRAGTPLLGHPDTSSLSWMPASSTPPVLQSIPAAQVDAGHPARRKWLAAGAVLAFGVALSFWFAGRPATVQGSRTPLVADAPLPATAPPPAPSVVPSATSTLSGTAEPAATVTPIVRRVWTAPVRAPAHITPAPPQAAPPSAEPKRGVDCSSPYYVDDRGLKQIRPECL